MKSVIKTQSLLMVSLIAGLFATGQVQAATVYVSSVTGFITQGDDMDGMRVTATFTDNTKTETLEWGSTVLYSGGVSSTNGWSLSMSIIDPAKHSFDTPWTFDFGTSGLSLTRLVLDGISGDTVFDKRFESIIGPAPVPVHNDGTVGSADGVTYSGPGTATYSDPVALMGSDPVEDIWATLTIDFGANGIASNFIFSQDTDNVVSRVPEPASLALLGLGLIGLGYSRRRKS